MKTTSMIGSVLFRVSAIVILILRGVDPWIIGVIAAILIDNWTANELLRAVTDFVRRRENDWKRSCMPKTNPKCSGGCCDGTNGDGSPCKHCEPPTKQKPKTLREWAGEYARRYLVHTGMGCVGYWLAGYREGQRDERKKHAEAKATIGFRDYLERKEKEK